MQTLIYGWKLDESFIQVFLSCGKRCLAASLSAYHLSIASVSWLSWGCGCYEINLSGDLAVADVTGCCSQ